MPACTAKLLSSLRVQMQMMELENGSQEQYTVSAFDSLEHCHYCVTLTGDPPMRMW